MQILQIVIVCIASVLTVYWCGSISRKVLQNLYSNPKTGLFALFTFFVVVLNLLILLAVLVSAAYVLDKIQFFSSLNGTTKGGLTIGLLTFQGIALRTAFRRS